MERFLEGKGPAARALWDRLVQQVSRCGAFEFAPAKTRVAFMVRVRFLAVTALSQRSMTFHLWLREPLDSPRFFRIDHLGPRAHIPHIHWTRVHTPEQIDNELAGAICASYRIGRGDA